MKRIIGLTVAAAFASMLLFSCYVLPSRTTGSVSFRLNYSGVRAADPSSVQIDNPDTIGNTVRVYLYTYGTKEDSSAYDYHTFNGKIYDEFANEAGAEAQTITIDNIESGWYRVLVSTGTTTDGHYAVRYYGESEVFYLVPGSNDISLDINPTPVKINPTLLGQNVVGVRTISGTQLYAATQDTVYEGTASDADALADTTSQALAPIAGFASIMSGGGTIQSLSKGYSYPSTPVLFVNTDKEGIIPFNGSSFNTAFSQNLPPKVDDLTGLQSGAIAITDADALVVFYQRDGGLGWTYLTSSDAPAADQWLDYSTADLVKGKPIYDFVPHGNYIYVATKLGAFQLSKETFKTASSANIVEVGVPFGSSLNSQGKIIQSLGITLDGTSLYIGTSSGLYRASLQESNSDNPVGSPQLVSGTLGESVTKISVNSAGDIAFRSQDNVYFIAADSQSSKPTSYPAYAGLPGELSSMAWGGTNDKTLYIAGDEGLVAITLH